MRPNRQQGDMSNDKPIVMMTGAELKALVKEVVEELSVQAQKQAETATLKHSDNSKEVPTYAVGWGGLAQALGVSINTARKYYETGALEGACVMTGGTLVTRPELARKQWSEYKAEQKNNKTN